MPAPTVTFIVPCFNHGAFVREAVASALDQKDADVRVVVVNDGSNDGTTPAVCDGLASDRVTVIHQPNRGLPAARNRGAREASGEYLVFLDADDFVRPTFVSALHGAIAADPDPPSISHAYCQEELIELGTGIWKVPEWDPLLLMITNLHPVTTLLKRACFEEVGGFDETMTRGYEDWEFWLRLSQRGRRAVRVREPLFVWRRHSHSTMVMEAVTRHGSLVDEIMDRNRAIYTQRAREVVALSNALLRKFECNWIDETGYPIVLQYLWSCRDRFHGAEAQCAALRAQVIALESQVAALRSQIGEATRALADMESSGAVRLRRSAQRFLAALPGPLSSAARPTLRLLKRLVHGRTPRSS